MPRPRLAISWDNFAAPLVKPFIAGQSAANAAGRRTLPVPAFVRVQNMVPDSVTGIWRPRGGFYKGHASAAPIGCRGLARGLSSGGADKYYYFGSNGSVYRIDGSLPPTGFSFTSIAGASSHGGSIVDYADFNDKLYVSDGAVLNKITMSTDTWASDIAGTPTNVDGLAVFNNRLWGFRRNALYFSSLGNGDTLGNTSAGGGSFTLPQFIRSLVTYREWLLVFHLNEIGIMSGWGQADFQYLDGRRGLSMTYGISDRSAWTKPAVVDGALFYPADQQNAFVKIMGSEVTRVESPLDNVFALEVVSPVLIPFLGMNPEMLLISSEAGSNPQQIMYFPKTGRFSNFIGAATHYPDFWTTFGSFPASIITCESDATQLWVWENIPELAISADGADTDRTGGTSQTYVLKTNILQTPSHLYAAARRLRAKYAAVSAITVSLIADGATVASLTLPATGGVTAEEEVVIHAWGKGRQWQLEFTTTNAADDWAISSVTLELIGLGERAAMGAPA